MSTAHVAVLGSIVKAFIPGSTVTTYGPAALAGKRTTRASLTGTMPFAMRRPKGLSTW